MEKFFPKKKALPQGAYSGGHLVVEQQDQAEAPTNNTSDRLGSIVQELTQRLERTEEEVLQVNTTYASIRPPLPPIPIFQEDEPPVFECKPLGGVFRNNIFTLPHHCGLCGLQLQFKQSNTKKSLLSLNHNLQYTDRGYIYFQCENTGRTTSRSHPRESQAM